MSRLYPSAFLVLLLFSWTLSLLFAAVGKPSDVVFVTKSGSAYHKESCAALKSSKIPMKLGEAVSEGYTPCGICKPPELLGSPKKAAGAAAKAEDGLYRVSALKLSSYKEADTRRMARAKVVRHIDGDTVELRFENPPAGIAEVEKIRMIGVDTPETVHPKKEVEFFGKEASEFTKSALLYKDVFAAFDWDTRDRYGRLLVYIYTAPGVCHNAELVRQGFAHAYTRFPFQFLEEFRALEASAREARRGLWAN